MTFLYHMFQGIPLRTLRLKGKTYYRWKKPRSLNLYRKSPLREYNYQTVKNVMETISLVLDVCDILSFVL